MQVTARPSARASVPPEPSLAPELAGGIIGAAAGTAVSAGLGLLLYATGEVSPVAALVATAATAWFVTPATTTLGALIAGVRAAERGP